MEEQMIPLSDVTWGPINATENDALFPEKWIEPDDIKNCLDFNCWIVTGEKGSGKTAIQKAMREIHSEAYYAAPLVDFDKVTFKLLYENLVHLSNTTQLSKTVTLSNYWQYCIVVELIRSCVRKSPDIYGDLLDEVPEGRREDIHINNRLMRLLEEAWNKIDDFTASRAAEGSSKRRANMLASSGLSADLLHDLSTFPLGEQFDDVKSEFFRRVKSNGHRIVLILDGFDTLITQGTKPSSIQLIFSSLVDAILSLRSDPNLPTTLNIKAFIPHDRYLNMTLRDSDKVGEMHSSIRWSKDSLKEFVRKRIETTTKLNSLSFQNLWRQVMPETVFNLKYKIEEDSFDYILRHTLMRPRQIQIHLDMLARKYRGLNIDPSMIPNSIGLSSNNISKYFMDEYSLDHPNLERFILGLEDRCNVMEFSEFREFVNLGLKKFHGSDHDIDIDDKIDVLYSIGFFGVVRFAEKGDLMREQYYPPTRESRPHYVDFFYRKPYTKISSRIHDETPIAIHPIFVDFANLRPHNSLIIG
jgi:Cdc6-like AAA superfamily ATPase